MIAWLVSWAVTIWCAATLLYVAFVGLDKLYRARRRRRAARRRRNRRRSLLGLGEPGGRAR